MYKLIHIEDNSYHVEYNILHEERSQDHWAPEKLEITEVLDDRGNQVDESIIEEIEEIIKN